MKQLKINFYALTSAITATDSNAAKINCLVKFSLAAAILLFCCLTTASAQILYVQFNSNGTRQLRQVNADGSGDTAVALPFSTLFYPVWTRDASRFAISAPVPNTTQRSYNIFAINPATGATQQVTRFSDLFDPQTSVTSYTFALYKAFSPDQSLMAVGSDIGYSSGGTTTTPVLEVYSTTVVANPTLVHVHAGRNGKHHAGEGVDWSPNQNTLVTGIKSSAPFQSGGTNTGEVTPLLLVEPVTQAIQTGRFRQLTFPRADGGVGTGGGFIWGEHDYQPRFSPNGAGVAYVRSFQNFNLNNGSPDPDIQSLHIVNVNTGADTEVARFNAGFYISSLSWSPDGTKLVFEIGQQDFNSSSGYLQSVVLATSEIYTIGVNGAGFARLRTAGNGNPAWRPSGAVTPPTAANKTFDFDGDGKTDIGVFRNGSWFYLASANGSFASSQFGQAGDRLAPADFDADGRTDLAVFRSGNWYILQSSNGAFRAVAFGAAGDLPRPGDFDGDNKADIAVFRPSTGTWYRLNSGTGAFVSVQFGQNGDAPILGDFDADGKADVCVFRSGAWYYLRSSTGAFVATTFGQAGDVPVAGKYDADSATDLAVFRPANGTWYLLRSQTGFTAAQFGQNGDRPVPGDYDGDGKNDFAVYRGGNWYVLRSANNSFSATAFGIASDAPVPAAFLP